MDAVAARGEEALQPGYTGLRGYLQSCSLDHSRRQRGGYSKVNSAYSWQDRIGQEYNRRKKRKGAFWEDRYHTTAIETGEHLLRCLVYVDIHPVK